MSIPGIKIEKNGKRNSLDKAGSKDHPETYGIMKYGIENNIYIGSDSITVIEVVPNLFPGVCLCRSVTKIDYSLTGRAPEPA